MIEYQNLFITILASILTICLIYIWNRKTPLKSNYYLFWTKVQLALELHVKEALLYLLHNRGNDPLYNGLPEDHGQLYLHLQNWWNNLPLNDQKRLDVKILNQNQKDHLFPSSRQQVDSSTWDVTLIVVIIRNCIPALKPFNGWDNFHVGDQSKGANVIRARDVRNKLKHGSLNDIDTQQKFDDVWGELTKILNELGYTNMKKFQELKTDSSLNIYVEETNKIFEAHLDALKQNYLDEYDQKTKALIQFEMNEVAQSLQICENKVQDLENKMTLKS